MLTDILKNSLVIGFLNRVESSMCNILKIHHTLIIKKYGLIGGYIKGPTNDLEHESSVDEVEFWSNFETDVNTNTLVKY